MDYRLTTIPAEHVIPLAGKLIELIKTISYHDEYDPLEILGKAMCKEYQIWGIAQGSELVGIYVTHVFTAYGKKGCRIVLVAGKNLTKCTYLIQDIVDWCKAQGCDYVEGTGRSGIEPYLTALGFEKVATTMRVNTDGIVRK